MPTVFIALQCCQCSTMQVKQQKKSSNKWTCVVCNQKQSVRKVFAQGFMAKDVRQFVQNFNMSRQLAEQNVPQFDEQEQTLGIEEQVSGRRTDWTEYIDPNEDSSNADENKGDEFEPKIVTELPKPLFKKPKLNNYRLAKVYVDGGEETLGENGRKYNRSHFSSHAAESSGHGNSMLTGARQERADDAGERKRAAILERKKPVQQISKWEGQFIRDDGNKFADELPRRIQASKAKVHSGSKWSCYMTEEEEEEEKEEGGDLVLGRGKDPRTHAVELSNQNAYETPLMDQMVDEEIHPDFL